MKRLELLVPPPLVMLATGLLMWLLAGMFPVLTLSWPHSTMAGGLLGLAGAAVSLVGVITFRRAGTTMDPRHGAQTSALVSSGIYRRSRNPMYLGVLLVLAGWALYLGHLLAILCLPLFIAYITYYQILPEERLLHERFGAEFLTYRGRVRRWI